MGLRICIIGWFDFPYGSASASRIRTLGQGLVENGCSVHVLSTHRITFRLEDKTSTGSYAYKAIAYETTNAINSPKKSRTLLARILNHSFAIVQSWWRFWGIAKRNECDAVYIYGRSFTAYAPICLIAKIYRIRIFFDICEWFPASRYREGIFNLFFVNDFLGRQLPRLNGRVIAITSYIKAKYDQYRVPCILIPSVYESSPEFAKDYGERHRQESDQFHLAYSGSCKANDGVEILLNAVRIALKAGVPVHLNLLGSDGKSGSSLVYGRQIDQDSLLKNHVSFRGRLGEDEYAQALASADCLVLPRPDSQTNRAAFPTRLPEFLATGRPVLTSDTPDVPVYLEAGKHAEIVSAKGEAESLAQGILSLWQNKKRANEIGRAGQLRGDEIFNYRLHAKSLCDFINGEQAPEI